MKKGLKKLLGVVVTAVMCLALVPAQAVKAEEKVDFTTLTEAQAKEILYGTWVRSYDENPTFADEFVLDGETWYFTSVRLYEESAYFEFTNNVAAHEERCIGISYGGNDHHDAWVEVGTFEDKMEGGIKYGVSFGFYDVGGWGSDSYGFHTVFEKVLANGETMSFEDVVAQVLAGSSKEESKLEVKTEANGREVLEGEVVYVVKKGDCLWNIAKALLGDGKKYTELYTRNNDILEKATLIFPGQEIIVPAR